MKKYVFSLAITAAIFVTAFLASNYLSQRRVQEIRSITDQISLDILSTETQFDLLEEISCRDISDTALTRELNSIAQRLSYLEENRGTDDPEVITLKKYYSLLQLKDYVLMERITDKCKDLKPIFLFYFYSNQGDCEECEKTGFVLTRLRQDYPDLRIYAFDYNMGINALDTFININKVEEQLPAFHINGKNYYGFHSVEDIERLIPELRSLKATTTSDTATTTNRQSTTSKPSTGTTPR